MSVKFVCIGMILVTVSYVYCFAKHKSRHKNRIRDAVRGITTKSFRISREDDPELDRYYKKGKGSDSQETSRKRSILYRGKRFRSRNKRVKSKKRLKLSDNITLINRYIGFTYNGSMNETWANYNSYVLFSCNASDNSSWINSRYLDFKDNIDEWINYKQRVKRFFKKTNATKLYSPDALRGIFTSLDSIMAFLQDQQFEKDKAVKALTRKFKKTQKRALELRKMYKRKKPFIVIEGIFSAGRSKVARHVARALKAYYILNPIEIMKEIRKRLLNPFIRKAYYALSKYAASYQMMHMYMNKTVVMERYWLDQAAFMLAKAYVNKTLPLHNSTYYMWPCDLRRPDITFFINADCKPESYFLSENEKNNITLRTVEVFRRMQPPVVEISSNKTLKEMVKYIAGYVNRTCH